jgi:hypothetical protein
MDSGASVSDSLPDVSGVTPDIAPTPLTISRGWRAIVFAPVGDGGHPEPDRGRRLGGRCHRRLHPTSLQFLSDTHLVLGHAGADAKARILVT